MKKVTALLISLMLGVLCVFPGMIFAEEAAEDTAQETEQSSADETADTAEVQDQLVTTQHSAVIQGQTIDYTATAGTMVVESGDGSCEIFFVAYMRDGVEDLSERPITFVFNGGPGSSSIMTHLLFMGPKRMEPGEKGHASTLPVKWIDNENSILDMTDLVFIDAVGTGYSRACPDSNEDDFIGYDNDLRTIGDFIRLYVSRNQRWSSPKYIAGESYGTTRAVGLCDYLSSSYDMGLNGIILVSSVNDFLAVSFGPGNDLPYAAFLPTYAADAWYHQQLDESYQSMSLEDYLEEVRGFAGSEYQAALIRGRGLSEDEKDEIAGKIASYIGLDKETVLKYNLRIPFDNFSQELLADQKLVTGRLDGRFTGPQVGGNIDDGAGDPSSFDLNLPLVAMANQYFSEELGYHTDRPYINLSLDVNYKWIYGVDNSFLAQEDVIHDCMTKNSFLKVWVLCGYYDGATPFYGAEWVFDHVFLSEDQLDNLSFTYYPSGHMIYLDQTAFDQFRKDAENWFQQ